MKLVEVRRPYISYCPPPPRPPPLQEYLLTSAKVRKWEFSTLELTDQPMLHLVEDIVREKICIHTDKEIPYVTKQVSGVASGMELHISTSRDLTPMPFCLELSGVW